MKTRFSKVNPRFPYAYSTGFNLHSFYDDGERIGPGHYRLTSPPAADGTGIPAGLAKYNGQWVRALNGKIYIGDVEESTYAGAVSFASMKVSNGSALLICADGTTIKAYDAANPTWSFQSLGIEQPADGFTLTPAWASGILDNEATAVNLAGGEDAVAATKVIGTGTGKLAYTALVAGDAGNSISVWHKAGTGLSVAVVGTAITVTLDSGVSTAANVKTAVDGSAAAALISTAVDTAGVVGDEITTTNLAGGVDAISATVSLGGGANPGIMTYTALIAGVAGNAITVWHKVGTAEGISVVGNDISIVLNSGTSDVETITALVDDTPAAVALVTATHNVIGYLKEGVHFFRITYVDVWGHESPPSNAKAVTCGKRAASVIHGTGTGKVKYTAQTTGSTGNDISVWHKNGAALSVAVVAKAISVTLNSGVSTAADVIAAVNGDATAAALVVATVDTAGVVGDETAAEYLAGGGSNYNKVTIAGIAPYTAYKAHSIRIYKTLVNGNDNGYDSEYRLENEIAATSTTHVAITADQALTLSLQYGDWLPGVTNEMPVGNNLKVWQDRLVWSNGNELSYSRLDNWGWSLPGNTENTFAIGDDSDIIAVTNYQEHMLIWKADGIYIVAGEYDENYFWRITIKLINGAVGISSKYHVVEYKGTVAFYSQGNVYVVPQFDEPLSKEIAPLFSEWKSVQDDVRLGTDHEGRLYVVGYVPCTSIINGLPYVTGMATRYYVGYIFDPQYGWSGTFNFDWQYMLADYANNQTRVLDKLGYIEVIDYSKAWEKSPASLITTNFTVVNTSQITVLGITSHLKVGDYIYFYPAESDGLRILHMSKISVIVDNDIGTDEAIFVAATGVVGVGCKFVMKGAKLRSDSEKHEIPSALNLLFDADNATGYFGGGYDPTTNFMQLHNDIVREDNGCKLAFDRAVFLARMAYFYGIFNGKIIVEHQNATGRIAK